MSADDNNMIIFAIVQSTFSGLLKDSNPLVEEYPSQDKLCKILVWQSDSNPGLFKDVVDVHQQQHC